MSARKKRKQQNKQRRQTAAAPRVPHAPGAPSVNSGMHPVPPAPNTALPSSTAGVTGIDWFSNLNQETEHTVMTRNVYKIYQLGEEKVHALNDVSITINRGEYVSLMGPSGSGKTTLFNIVGALLKPTEGNVFIDEVDVAQLDANELAWLRCRKIGYIFQSYNIVKVFSALENVTLPMLFAGVPPDEAQDRGVAILERVGLGDRILHTPKELSGGQQQRVAIARAFANRPAIILADEPTANLDLHTGEEIIHLMKEMNREQGVTVICATHDHKMLDISDRIAWMEDGRLDKIAQRDEVKIQIASMASK